MIINEIKKWVENYVVKHNFCPFAAKVYIEDRIHYKVVDSEKVEDCLTAVNEEFLRLDQIDSKQIDTTLIVFTNAFSDFQEYLNALELAETLLADLDYEGVYQLASFHPEYQFAGEEKNDPANFTNRAPFPIIHILREDSVSEVLETFDDPNSIPNRNIKFTRGKGFDWMDKSLKSL